MGNHGAAGVISERRHSSCFSLLMSCLMTLPELMLTYHQLYPKEQSLNEMQIRIQTISFNALENAIGRKLFISLKPSDAYMCR